jgi:glycosyltransferase involved in cell wall biosynthesis
MPKISVIIPCYNQGIYVDEAVESVLNQTMQDFEIIIINDGSTDVFTNELLKNYSKPKTKVISILNGGLSNARNVGIKESHGTYILPLDADDKIAPSYLEEAITQFEKNENLTLVYGRAEYFGSKTGEWNLPLYKFKDLLFNNLIYCSAIYKRADYDKTSGYNPNMKYGLEDWDFWISLLEHGGEVHKIDSIMFYYRIKENSMILAIDSEKQLYLKKQIYINHIDLYTKLYNDPLFCIHEMLVLQYKQMNQEKILNSRVYKITKFLLKNILGHEETAC